MFDAVHHYSVVSEVAASAGRDVDARSNDKAGQAARFVSPHACSPLPRRTISLGEARAHLSSVEPEVAGTRVVLRGELERRLGRIPFLVWLIFSKRRDRGGVTRLTMSGATRAPEFERLRYRAVNKACGVLIEAGLLEPIGWTAMAVPYRRRTITRDVYLRRVRGALLPYVANDGERALRCIVPTATEVWMANRTGWGGRRIGAGRPANNQALSGVTLTTQGNSQVCETTSAANSRGGNLPPQNEFKRGHRLLSLSGTESLSKERDKAGTRSVPGPTVLGFVDVLDDGHGNAILGGPLRPRSRPDLTGMPSYPGSSIVSAARCPDPPLLNPAAPEDDQLALLTGWYRGALSKAFPGTHCFLPSGAAFDKPCRKTRRRKKGAPPPKKKPLPPPTWRAHLGAAATALIEAKIPPAAWALWSMHVWKGMAQTSGRPSLEWVFSPQRIATDAGWFNSEIGGYMGGRVCHGPILRQLLVLWNMLEDDVWHRGMTVADALKLRFPDGYDRMLEAARTEGVQIREAWDRRKREGKFIWG